MSGGHHYNYAPCMEKLRMRRTHRQTQVIRIIFEYERQESGRGCRLGRGTVRLVCKTRLPIVANMATHVFDRPHRLNAMDDAYGPLKPSRTMGCEVRGLRYGVRLWGPNDAPPLVLLHGSRDTSLTFQFLVDAFAGRWRIVAPDWRGHGLTPAVPQGYWFHELLADLDVLLATLFPQEAVSLVGHSLGGNLASVYAGLRPGKVTRMVSIDGFGILAINPAEFPGALSRWLGSDHQLIPKPYASVIDMARRLLEGNRRLTWDKALFLAANSSRPSHDGGFAWKFQLRDWRSMPTLHTLEEWIACWHAISAPALWIAAAEPQPGTVAADPAAFAMVLHHLGAGSVVRIAETGHNVHHDAPDALATVIEEFLASKPQPVVGGS